MLLILIHVLITALGVLVAAKLVPGVHVRSFGSAFVFAVVLGILNAILFKVLVFLSLPFVLLSLGLFVLVINGFLFWLADKIVKGVETEGFGSAFLGGLVTSAVSLAAKILLHV
jgi:putative membrane protein